MKRLSLSSTLAITAFLLLSAPDIDAIEFFGTGAEVQVNQTTPSAQWTPDVARLTDGRLVAVWDNNGYIEARLFNADTSPAGDEFRIDEAPYASTNSFSPDVSALPGGGFIVTWQGYVDTNSVFDVFARAFDNTATPIAATFRVNEETALAQNRPLVEVFDNGTILFVWQHDSGSQSTDWDIKFRLFNSNLTPAGGDLHLATTLLAFQYRPSATRLGDGSIVVVWDSEEYDGDATSPNVRARRIGPLGALGDAILVNTTELSVQFDPAVAAIGDDQFVVTWTYDADITAGDLSLERGEIIMRRFEFNELTDVITPLGGETQVNTTTTGSQIESSVVGWNGGYLVAWTSENNRRNAGDDDKPTGEDGDGAGVYARGYDLDGVPQTAPFRVNLTTINHQFQAKMASMNDYAAVVWSSIGQDGSAAGVYLRRIATDEGMVPADPDPTGAAPTAPPVAPTLSMNAPNAVVFKSKSGGKLPPPKSFRIRNTGESTLSWRADNLPKWLKVTPTAGVVGVGESKPVRLSLIKSKLPKGKRRAGGRVTFDATGNGVGDRTVAVSFVNRK